jgi:signal transduction histidine kinase
MCEPAQWPAAYGALRTEADRDPGARSGAARRLVDSLQLRGLALGVVPTVLPAAGGSDPSGRPPCDVSGAGILLVRLDLGVLRQSLLPEVVTRHLDALQRDFHVAIVSGPDRRELVYMSTGGNPATLASRPDLVVPLTIAVTDRTARGGARGGSPRAPGSHGPRGDFDDGWLLVAQHRAGSLEKAVTSLRARNLGISFGILILMGIAVAIIGANARKAERLGRQQLEFVAAVSHEMRTPVTAIDVAARNLEDGLVSDPARVRRYGGVIRAETRRLTDTVERVLRFASLEAGRGLGPAVNVDLKSLVEEIVSTARAEHPEATIELDVEGNTFEVQGDPAALRSSVQNLVGNALKYGGPPAWARVQLARADGPPPEIRVTVEDRGPGIDARDAPYIFDPFYRGRLATERRLPGNGLGLHIVKRSIEGHGGRVSIRSGHGPGTAVTVHLPLPSGASPDDGATTTPPAR